MHNDDLRDDLPIGRLLTRREALALIGGSGLALVGRPYAAHAASDAMPACVVRPAQTEGPFFVEGELERSDIRSDARGSNPRPGTPLTLRFNVARIGGASCLPLPGAQVHVWHSDANGEYSDSDVRSVSSTSRQFLRGYQLTDAAGAAKFVTIFPGWYGGRTAHIHFKIRLAAAPGSNTAQPGVHVAALLRRRVVGSRVRRGALRQPRQARRAQRRRFSVSQRREAIAFGHADLRVPGS